MNPFDLYRSRGAKRGWVHTHGPSLVELFRFADAALVIAGLWMANRSIGLEWTSEQWLIGLATIIVFHLAARQWGVYRSWRASPLREELYRLAAGWLSSVMVMAALMFLLSADPRAHRGLLPAWCLITLALLVGTRLIVRMGLRAVRRRGGNFRTAAIIGATGPGHHIASMLEHCTWMGVKVLGIYDDRAPATDRTLPDLAHSGDLAVLHEAIEGGHVDLVYIALPLRAELRIRQLVDELRNTNVSVQFVADFSALGLLNARWEVLGGMPTVSLYETPHQGVDGLLKRCFDIAGSMAALIFLSAPMLMIALAIKLDSPGPIIFRQRRHGLDGRQFEIYKFRTMRVAEEPGGFVQAKRHDARVTRLGALLRRTSADELPQFINVLQGRMSIVGPRPHPLALDDQQRKVIDGYMLRHKVRPGITGWAQVNGYRGETDTPDKMLNRIRYDLEYINDWSLWLDIRIVWLTLFKVFGDPHAY